MKDVIEIGIALVVGATLDHIFYAKEIAFGKAVKAIGLKDLAAVKSWLGRAKSLL